MKRPWLAVPLLRGFTVQLFAITILLLTLLLLLIAFGSISLHQHDMRGLVSERDARAVQFASAALEAELRHRDENVFTRAAFAGPSRAQTFEKLLADFRDTKSDFDGGLGAGWISTAGSVSSGGDISNVDLDHSTNLSRIAYKGVGNSALFPRCNSTRNISSGDPFRTCEHKIPGSSAVHCKSARSFAAWRSVSCPAAGQASGPSGAPDGRCLAGLDRL
jgi:hypothetical protein